MKNKQQRPTLSWIGLQKARTTVTRSLPTKWKSILSVIGSMTMCYFMITIASVLSNNQRNREANTILEVKSFLIDIICLNIKALN